MAGTEDAFCSYSRRLLDWMGFAATDGVEKRLTAAAEILLLAVAYRTAGVGVGSLLVQ